MEIDFFNTNGSSSPKDNILVIRFIYLYLLPWLSTNKTRHKWAGYAYIYRPKDSLCGRREWGAPLGVTPMA